MPAVDLLELSRSMAAGLMADEIYLPEDAVLSENA
jgi:hypothetical protein